MDTIWDGNPSKSKVIGRVGPSLPLLQCLRVMHSG